MASAAQEKLLRVLHDRDIPLQDDDLAWAFTDPRTRTAAEAFVRDHLQPSTLLTKDEAEFHERHARSTSNESASIGRPLTDAELEAAVNSLEASTAAIERQARLLESQRDALREIKFRNSSVSRSSNTRRSNLDRQTAQLDFDIEELSQNARSRLHAASKQADAVTSGIPSQVERLLEKDDRLLDGLQKLLPKVSDSPPDGEESASVEQLCSALAAVSIKEIRTRLSRAYQEGMNDYGRSANGTIGKDLNEQQQKQRATLRAELEELSGEIDGLVGILVDYRYRKPLKQSQVSALTEHLAQQSRWSEYTVSGLAYLTARLDAVNDHLQRLHAHRAAVQGVSMTLEDVITPQQVKASAANTSTPQTLDLRSAKGLKPLKLVQANLSEGQDPAIQLLRQQEVRMAETDSTSRLSETLSTTLRNRNARLSNLSKSVEHSTTDAIAQSLAKTDSNAQDLLAAVYVHSSSDDIRLASGGVQASINSLELDTQRLGDEMRTLDTDAIARALIAKQGEVVKRLSGE